MSAAQAREVARFTGGIPGLVAAASERARGGKSLPTEHDLLLHSLGPLVDEIRGAVDIVQMDTALADRLDSLLEGEPSLMDPDVDRPLQLAGLIRPVRAHGQPHVTLRAPAIAALLT